jgi:hypothetical protein
MQENPVETAEPVSSASAPSARRVSRPVTARRAFRLGIGGRLALGLAAVAGVILVGHTVATETTRKAVEAVRSMQQDHEPIARRAGTVVEKLVAYDRAVSEYLQAARSPDMASITSAHAVLDAAMSAYFEASPAPALTPAAADLRTQMAGHIARGQALAEQAAQRADWLARRHSALDELQKRVTSAGGAGVRIDQDQVFARRSLAELTTAANALRGFGGGTGSGIREEKDFAAVLSGHSSEFARSPGRAWLDLVREDFDNSIRLRNAIEKFDVTNCRPPHAADCCLLPRTQPLPLQKRKPRSHALASP